MKRWRWKRWGNFSIRISPAGNSKSAITWCSKMFRVSGDYCSQPRLTMKSRRYSCPKKGWSEEFGRVCLQQTLRTILSWRWFIWKLNAVSISETREEGKHRTSISGPRRKSKNWFGEMSVSTGRRTRWSCSLSRSKKQSLTAKAVGLFFYLKLFHPSIKFWL